MLSAIRAELRVRWQHGMDLRKTWHHSVPTKSSTMRRIHIKRPESWVPEHRTKRVARRLRIRWIEATLVLFSGSCPRRISRNRRSNIPVPQVRRDLATHDRIGQSIQRVTKLHGPRVYKHPTMCCVGPIRVTCAYRIGERDCRIFRLLVDQKIRIS